LRGRASRKFAKCNPWRIKNTQPLRTFARYRKFPRGVMFGQNMIFDGPGTLRVGDTVDVASRVDLSLA
jgi:uncharacterized protein YcbX